MKYSISIIITLLFFGCGSNNDDCTKTIIIPQFYYVNNQSYSYNTTQEVPCDFPEPNEPELTTPPTLENFTYEVLNFTFTPDTGNNTSRLQFEIKLNNNNNYSVTGVPILTLVSNGTLEFSTNYYSNNASIPCFGIDANSYCILTYDKEESLDSGTLNSLTLKNVKYYLTN